MGIKSEFLPYVFDRFRQADSTTTRQHGGLGLGLAIVRHLVELHHGTIHAESEGEGKGATFTVELMLPNIPPPPPNGIKQRIVMGERELSLSEISSESSKMLSGLRVMLVDDEPDVRELLTTVIEGAGANVIAVASAQEAIEVLEQSQPDVLVSDIAMPQEDGYTLIRKVRDWETERGGCLPAVALTAYVRDEDSQLAIDSGFQIHMSKPIVPTQLVVAVANLAGRVLTQEI